MDLEKVIKESNLDILFESRYENFEQFINSKFYIDEEKKAIEDEEKLTNLLKELVGEEKYNTGVLNALNDFEVSYGQKGKFWNKYFFKLGYYVANSLEDELKRFEETKVKDTKINRSGIINKLSDFDLVTFLSEFIEKKTNELNAIKEFKEKHCLLEETTEEFEKILTDEQKEKFNELMTLMYQVDEYYFSYAYLLGQKN